MREWFWAEVKAAEWVVSAWLNSVIDPVRTARLQI